MGVEERLRAVELAIERSIEWRRLREEQCEKHDTRFESIEDTMYTEVKRVNDRIDTISTKIAWWAGGAAALGAAIPVLITIILWYAGR